MQMDTKKYCANCGHEQHDGALWRTEIDYDGREYKIEVCKHFRDNAETFKSKPKDWF